MRTRSLQYASTKISTFGLAVIATMMAMAVGDAQTPKTATPSSGVAYFTAAPTSGQAPLTVTFCAFAGIAIDFGDGTSSGMSRERLFHDEAYLRRGG